MKKKGSLGTLLLVIAAVVVYQILGGGSSEAPETRATSAPAISQTAAAISESGEYTDKESVALYLHTYGHLPGNYITKKQAEKQGWNPQSGNLAEALPGKSIGGDHYGNYEGKLPEVPGRSYRECDIGYTHGGRNAKRIIWSSDGQIYYTQDHYNSFEQLYLGGGI